MTDSPAETTLAPDAQPRWKGGVRGTPSGSWLTIVEQTLHRAFSAVEDLNTADQAAFELAVVEITSNQIVHRPPGGGWCSMKLTITDDTLVADFRDDGPGVELAAEFRMPGVEAEAGRGLAIVSMVLDEFRHETTSEGNQWLLIKRRQGSG